MPALRVRIPQVRELKCARLVPEKLGHEIRFENISVYTPDGRSLLLARLSLAVSAGESCLIMGPSGIGKSSMLRVLGTLWPLFRSDNDIRSLTKFVRPNIKNMFPERKS